MAGVIGTVDWDQLLLKGVLIKEKKKSSTKYAQVKQQIFTITQEVAQAELNFGQPCILKVRNNFLDCLNHEYQVGLRLNDYHQRYGFVIKTLAYQRSADKACLLTTQAEGHDFHDIIKTLNKHDTLLIFYQLFLELEQLGRLAEFTHFDIHLANIRVQKLSVAREKQYRPNVSGNSAFAGGVKISTKYELFLFDFGYSHIKGVGDTWVAIDRTSIKSGSICSVYDPVYDLYGILGKMQCYIDVFDDQLFDMMLADKFIPYEGNKQQRVRLGRVGKELIYELRDIPDHNLFGSLFYCPQKVTPSSATREELAKNIEAKLIGLPTSSADRFSDFDQQSAKAIGTYLQQLKMNLIKSRKYDRTSMVNYCINLFDKLIRSNFVPVTLSYKRDDKKEFKITGSTVDPVVKKEKKKQNEVKTTKKDKEPLVVKFIQ